jgi:acetyl-CoA carboxylase biotin carboxylase subunit
MLTGIDLVATQIRIASGEPLGFTQADVPQRGHAIEFRINAEDPDHAFRPDPGAIVAFAPPQGSDGVTVRWDSAVVEGYRIPPHYDSMIGKLIVHGPDRAAALAGAQTALRSLRVEGIKTTIPLHLRILEDESFLRGSYDLDLLAKAGLVRTG